MTKRFLATMLGGALLCTTLPAMAAPAVRHAARHAADASTAAQTDALNAQRLQKARSALPQPTAAGTAAPAASPVSMRAGPGSTGRAASHAVQAAGTGETAGSIPVPRTQMDGAGE